MEQEIERAITKFIIFGLDKVEFQPDRANIFISACLIDSEIKKLVEICEKFNLQFSIHVIGHEINIVIRYKKE